MAAHKKSSSTSVLAVVATLAITLTSGINPIPSNEVQAATIGDICPNSFHFVVSVDPVVCEIQPNWGSFVVPAGVTSIDVLVVGGGGGGAKMPFTNTYNELFYPIYSGGGGGGDIEVCKDITVTALETLSFVEGPGGYEGREPIDFHFSGSNPNYLGDSGDDGGASSLSRATDLLCSAEGGKGGRGGDGDSGTRGHGGASGSAQVGGSAAFVNLETGITNGAFFYWSSSGGGGAAGPGQPGTFIDGVYKGGSGGLGISPSTLGINAGLFLNDLNIYGTGGPGGGRYEATYARGTDVDDQSNGYAAVAGSGGAGVLGANPDTSSSGVIGAVRIRYLMPSSSPTSRNLTIVNAGTGTGTVSVGTTTKNDGETFTTVATPSTGSVFAGWSCTPSSYNTANATLTFTVSENVSCTATFNLSPGGPDPEEPSPGGGSNGSLAPPIVDPPSNSGESNTDEAEIEPTQEFILKGFGLDKVTRVNVGSKDAIITLKTATELGIVIPKNLSAGVYDLSLYGSFGSMTEAKYFKVLKKRIVRISAGFAGDSPVMTEYIRGTILKFLKRLPGHVTMICVGSTRITERTQFEVELAAKRAKRSCSYAKSLSPNVNTQIRIKPSQGLEIGKRNVKLILMNY